MTGLASATPDASLVGMAKPKTRPQRDMTTRTPAESGRRLLFLSFVISGPAGAILAIAGLRAHSQLRLIAGAVLLAAFTALLLTRRQWGAAALSEEVRDNPFKRPKPPEGPASADQGGCDDGRCGL